MPDSHNSAQPQINGHNHDDAEYEARRALLMAWRCMKRDDRPRQPKLLARVLAGTYAWPFPDFAPSAAERYALSLQADQIWRRAHNLIREISATFPSQNELAFAVALSDRVPSGVDRGKVLDQLFDFERAARALRHVQLDNRVNGKSPPAAKDEYVTDFVRRVFSYLRHVERADLKLDFASDGEPTTRAGVIVAKSIEALHIPLGSKLRNQMRKVAKEDGWRDDPHWWRHSLPTGRPVER